MEALQLAEDAMRERVALQHLVQNVLTDTIWIELAQKVMATLSVSIAEWSLDDIRRLLPLLDTEASRIIPDDFSDLDPVSRQAGLSAYDCGQIFQTRITILRRLLEESPDTLTAWQFAGALSGIRQKLNHYLTTLQGIRDVALHFAGLATASALTHNEITPPPPEHVAWGDTPEWKELRKTISAACEKVQKEVMMGN